MEPDLVTQRYEELSAGTERFVRPSLLPDSVHQLSATAETRRIDEATGLPLPFVPNPNIPTIVTRNIEREADWDHNYPQVETKRGANPALDLPYARYGLMHLRLQWATWREHHDMWNKYDLIGPQQPATPQQLAATMTFGLSGYIPAEGILLTKEGPKYCHISAEQRKYLVVSGQVMPQSTDYAIAYLRWFVMQQSTDHIRQVEVDEFLSTPDTERRMYLAGALAAKMVERAVEPFDATYTKLFSDRELNGLCIGRGRYVEHPRHPRDLLHSSILAKVGLRTVIDDLQQVFQPLPAGTQTTAA
jgi:hypothetical protein